MSAIVRTFYPGFAVIILAFRFACHLQIYHVKFHRIHSCFHKLLFIIHLLSHGKRKRRMQLSVLCNGCAHRISIPYFEWWWRRWRWWFSSHCTLTSKIHTSALSPDAHKIIILVENKQKKTHRERERVFDMPYLAWVYVNKELWKWCY